MARLRNILITLSIVTCMAASGLTGSLDAGLADQVAQANPGDKLAVWLVVNDNHDAAQFRAKAMKAAATRQARHLQALTELKAQAQSQTGLLQRLAELESKNLAGKIKGHWIANVVEAEVTVAELKQLAARSDVETIYAVPRLSLLAPDADFSPPPPNSEAPAAAGAIGSNLEHINAPEAWWSGYRGEGRLVCSFDTGVNGHHPALAERWRGLDGDSAAAWFYPPGSVPFPYHPPSFNPAGDWHGTHTMGIMVGASAGDTIGVAPAARWISAAVVDIDGTSFLDAFEWAADPDGDPNTVSDVPDVINHSWGYVHLQCLPVFYDAIDHTEALGIVNVFSSGNSGPTAASIANPADRALSPIDCFSVGNLYYTQETIWPGSSRGPAPCNGQIKPNVVAPGTSIRSSVPPSTYATAGGTSQAAPHVSGLVALLRQKNPNATVDEIKTAILTSARSHPNFGSLPNNDYGWGEIDCLAALAALPPDAASPNVRLYDFTHLPIQAGDTVTGRVVLQNLGAAATSISGFLTGLNEALTIVDGSLVFGNIPAGDTISSSDEITVIVSDTVTAGSILSLDLVLTPIFVTVRLHFQVEPQMSRSLATHNTGRLKFSLTNYGLIGNGPGSIFPLGGVGITFDGGDNDLWEGGLIVGNSFSQVSSSVHKFLWEPETDFKVAPGGDMQIITDDPDVAYQTYSAFNDSGATDPLGLLITQESYSYDPPNDDLAIITYTLKNISGSNLFDLHFGMFLNLDLGGYFLSNAGGYENSGDFTWMAYNDGGSLSSFRGIKLMANDLAAAGAVSYTVFRHDAPPDGDGFSSTEKYLAITSGFQFANTYKADATDLFLIVAAGPIDLVPEGVDTVSFVLMAGNTLGDLQAVALRSDSIITDVDEISGGTTLPQSFSLHQNYPNPFNPTTTISFELTRKSRYQLEILNMLGQTVYHTEAVGGPGQVDVVWEAAEYASGVYLYRVTIGKNSRARKMLLLK